MPDKYQDIRDRHEIELAKKLCAIDRKHNRIERNLYVTFFILVTVVIYFVYVC